MKEHEISYENEGDYIRLRCRCGWTSLVGEKYMAAVSDRHLNLVSEKGNTK